MDEQIFTITQRYRVRKISEGKAVFTREYGNQEEAMLELADAWLNKNESVSVIDLGTGTIIGLREGK